jgi:hypothetical protein
MIKLLPRNKNPLQKLYPSENTIPSSPYNSASRIYMTSAATTAAIPATTTIPLLTLPAPLWKVTNVVGLATVAFFEAVATG